MQELSIGGLTFVVEYRDFEGDRGPAVRVFGDVDGQRRQLLRFDCFDTDPHYHYDLEGENRVFHLDRLTMGCPVEFSLRQIRENLQAMIARAGFPELAAEVRSDEMAARVEEIRAAIEAERPADEPTA